MKISDKFVVAADREKVYKFVTEPDNFIKLIRLPQREDCLTSLTVTAASFTLFLPV
jgi:preprotein translocase subunit Sss1